MRDMYVSIPGKSQNRINAAYAFGGPVLAIKTINTNFSMDIREYITVDFTGFEKIIDTIGGIQMDVKEDEVPYCNVLSTGMQTMNGEQALAYARIRHTGRSDYERTERQRRVLNEIYKKIKARGVLALPGTVSKLLPYAETSLSNEEILKLALQAADLNVESIDQFRLPVDGYFSSQSIDGRSVLVPNIEENKNKLHEFIYGIN
jgi:LCP family protein required for cell wall assembly